MNPHEQEKLEHLVSQALRHLPARRAPSSLESRVAAEIARRAARPWWRKSFVHWPLPARAVFVIASAAVVRLAFTGLGWFSSSVDTTHVKSTVAADLHWIVVARNLVDAVNHTAAAILGSVSPVWLYGGITLILALYLALFGLGAAAYRTLYANR